MGDENKVLILEVTTKDAVTVYSVGSQIERYLPSDIQRNNPMQDIVVVPVKEIEVDGNPSLANYSNMEIELENGLTYFVTAEDKDIRVVLGTKRDQEAFVKMQKEVLESLGKAIKQEEDDKRNKMLTPSQV